VLQNIWLELTFESNIPFVLPVTKVYHLYSGHFSNHYWKSKENWDTVCVLTYIVF